MTIDPIPPERILPAVVLSYTPEALSEGLRVHATIAAAGVKLLPDLDHAQIQSEDPSHWSSAIRQATHAVFVVRATGYSDTSVIRREVRLARQLGRAIYAIFPNGVPPSPPFWLSSAEMYPEVSPELIQKLQNPIRVLCAPVMAPVSTQLQVERTRELQELKLAVLQTASARRPWSACGLWGRAGAGKSRLAARLCQDEDVVDTFSGGILWAVAGDPDAFKKIVNAVTDVATTSDVMTAAKGVLHNRTALLIVDDVWSSEDFAQLSLLGGVCTVLIVTRDLSVAGSSGSTVVTVDAMTADEAYQFFGGRDVVAEKADANQDSRDGGKKLAEKLCRWPLALSLARAAFLEERARAGNDARTFEELEQQVDRHGLVAFDLSGEGRDLSLARSFEVTFGRLRREDRARLEQLVSSAGANPLSSAAVLELWKNSAVPGNPAREPSDGLELLRRLNALGLIDFNRQSDTVTVDKVVYEIFREQGLVAQPTVATGRRELSSGEDRQKNLSVQAARAVLGGQNLPFVGMVELANRLKKARYFSYARQIFSRARTMREATEQRLWLGQQHALCTYKDPDLPTTEKLDRALEILEDVDDLAITKEQETLGLAGSIFKQKWEFDAQRLNLERSLGYYYRGYQQGIKKDYAYTAINTAYVLDTLAFQEERELKLSSNTAPDETQPKKNSSQSEAGVSSPHSPPQPTDDFDPSAAARKRKAEARRIRQEVVQLLPQMARQPGSTLKRQWWFLVTVAEAFFGLQLYDDARYWLKEAMALEVVDWEYEATARQLARLAFMQCNGAMPTADSHAYRTLKIFLNNDTAALRSIALGKVGLALSGGGFRASLFHIGVLAKLAEQDVLRHVEVLSCVSGGSIIGAQYYLELKNLLEKTADADITQQDYIDVVGKVERDFLEGVQTNLRTRLLANPFVNLMTVFWPNYTRTERLATLMETKLFQKASGREVHWLDELIVKPMGARDDFSPKFDNWRRAAKVPVIVLNATTLNTGHNWQFTATWMGEPPGAISTEIDGNDLLRRMYYWEAPKAYRKVRLGRAVAASACVPALFDPIQMNGLFAERTVALVDGGVHDNQGTASLAEQECSIAMVSDASGQMDSTLHPSGEALKISMRANNILMARVREAEFQELDGRRRTAQLKGFAFMHLKKDLDVDPVNWVDCTEPFEMFDEARPQYRRGPLTAYGILKDVQRNLAAIRTDLDSFTDNEAYALMFSGYRIAAHELQNRLQPIFQSTPKKGNWRFLAIEQTMSRAKDFEDDYDRMMAGLKAGKSLAFKIWRLSRVVQVVGLLLAALIAAGLWFEWAKIPWHGLAKLVGAGLASLVVITLVVWAGFRLTGARKSFTQIVSGLLLGTVGWIAALFHLCVIDKLFLRSGRVPQPKPEN